MARAAQELLQRHYKDVPIHIEALKENDIDAFGNGTGIMYVHFHTNYSNSGLFISRYPIQASCMQLQPNLCFVELHLFVSFCQCVIYEILLTSV